MAAERSITELERFLAERADHLLRTAVLLTGTREAGEDLLQTAVERLLRRWRRFDGDPEGYLRRTLCNLAIDGYRRAGCEPVVAALPTLLHPGLPLEPGIAGLLAAGLFSASSPPATVARALHTAIACGTLTEDGRQNVDGIEAIKLTSRAGSPISETIWVDPGTYLPVRVVIRSAGGFPVTQQTADITWLPPTAQNLAKLTVPVPAGFRRVPVLQAVLPILQTFARSLPAPFATAGVINPLHDYRIGETGGTAGAG